MAERAEAKDKNEDLPQMEADEDGDLDRERVSDDLSFALDELVRSEPEYDLAQNYFQGDMEEKFLSERMHRLLDGSGTDFYINLASRVVYAVTDRLEISAVSAVDEEEEEEEDEEPSEDGGEEEDQESSEDGGEEEDQESSEDEDEETESSEETDNSTESASGNNSTESASGNNSTESSSGGGSSKKEDEDEEDQENEATKVLNKNVWHYNELDIEAPEIHEKATYFGDSYVFVWESEDGENVDMFYNSPLTTRIIYDDENPRIKKFAIKRWSIGREDDQKVRVNLYYKDWVVKFISKKRTDSHSQRTSKARYAQEFKPFVDEFTDEEGVMPNPYGEIPIFHFRTARPYGRPEHLNAYGPQDALTKLVKSQMSATDFAAYPQRWALADPGAGTDDDLDWGDDDDVGPNEKTSNLISGPGRVWQLQNTREVGEFKAADADQFLKPMDKYIELMAAVTGTPLSYLHKVRGTSSTPLSGDSQKQTEVILLKKITSRQRSYASTWREAMKFAMSILGFEDVEINIDWASLYNESGKDFWDGVLAQQEAGVPIRQSLLEAGYTEAEVNAMGYTADKPDGKQKLNSSMQAMADAPLPPNLQANQMQPGQQPPQPQGGQPQQPQQQPQQQSITPPQV